jgi:heme A synthase
MVSVQSPDGELASGGVDLLAIGFGTTVAMWAVGYVGHMPLTDVPPVVFVSFMLLCLVVGGWIVGRATPRGYLGGLALGLIVGLLNLLILGSILAKPNDGQIVPQWRLWVSGYFAICLTLTTLGSLAGTAVRPRRPRTFGAVNGAAAIDWYRGFAWIACAATLLLISVGGLVTGFRAGMAVPDWPNTYGSNMFLYPLTKMTGGVFYEHAHRLLGGLVGFTTLTLAILLTINRRSRGALILVWIVGSCVLLQGVMGGIRVTDASPEIRAHLAVVHGFFAHLILAGMIGVAVMLSPPYPSRSSARKSVEASGDERSWPQQMDGNLAACLVLAILGQTLLGTLVRQMDIGLMTHLAVAILVVVLAIVVGVLMWGRYPHIVVLARGGLALMGVVILQLVLGGTALAFRTPPAAASPSAEQLMDQSDSLRPATHALLTTAHQTNAAVLLAIATLLAFWTWRIVARREHLSTVDSPAAAPQELAGLPVAR